MFERGVDYAAFRRVSAESPGLVAQLIEALADGATEKMAGWGESANGAGNVEAGTTLDCPRHAFGDSPTASQPVKHVYAT